MKPVYRNTGITRRQFLSCLSLPVALYVVSPGSLFAANSYPYGGADDLYGFADRDGMGPRLDAPVVQNSCSPLHGEQPILREIFPPDELAMMKSLLKSEFEYAGLPWEDSYQLKYSFQHYGVPDNSRNAKNLLSYCKRVHDFIYNRLHGLFNADMSWGLLNDTWSYNASEDSQFGGLIGRYTYYVLRVYVDHPTLDDLPSLVNAQPLDRAIHYIIADQAALPKYANLYIISGKTSLVAPFSELLHLTFHAPSELYAEELAKTISRDSAKLQAIDAGETVNEATAILLAREYINKYGNSERIVTINNMARSLNTRFRYLDNAISYIDRIGIQNSLDLYLESPASFMRNVSSV